MKNLIYKSKLLLTVLTATTLVCGLIYLSAQQVLRHLANDPQVQIAQNTAAALSRGESPVVFKELLPASSKTDMAASLAPFVIAVDENLKPVSSTVELAGKTPIPPDGVFEYAKTHGENRLTWQPRPGLRNATIVVHHDGPRPGFVLAGRSLRETETRVDKIGQLMLAGWLATVTALLALAVFLRLAGGPMRAEMP